MPFNVIPLQVLYVSWGISFHCMFSRTERNGGHCCSWDVPPKLQGKIVNKSCERQSLVDWHVFHCGFRGRYTGLIVPVWSAHASSIHLDRCWLCMAVDAGRCWWVLSSLRMLCRLTLFIEGASLIPCRIVCVRPSRRKNQINPNAMLKKLMSTSNRRRALQCCQAVGSQDGTRHRSRMFSEPLPFAGRQMRQAGWRSSVGTRCFEVLSPMYIQTSNCFKLPECPNEPFALCMLYPCSAAEGQIAMVSGCRRPHWHHAQDECVQSHHIQLTKMTSGDLFQGTCPWGSCANNSIMQTHSRRDVATNHEVMCISQVRKLQAFICQFGFASLFTIDWCLDSRKLWTMLPSGTCHFHSSSCFSNNVFSAWIWQPLCLHRQETDQHNSSKITASAKKLSQKDSFFSQGVVRVAGATCAKTRLVTMLSWCHWYPS